MKLIVALLSAAAIAITASPALAKSKSKKHRAHYAYTQTYAPAAGYWNGYGPGPAFSGRNDPSLGHPSATALSRQSGRCIEDLGYGRYKYCGW